MPLALRIEGGTALLLHQGSSSTGTDLMSRNSLETGILGAVMAGVLCHTQSPTGTWWEADIPQSFRLPSRKHSSLYEAVQEVTANTEQDPQALELPATVLQEDHPQPPLHSFSS